MRAAIVAPALCACLHTSVDTDGTWSSLDEPCVSVGEQRALVESRFSLWFVPAGETLLYSGGQTVSQLDLASGDRRLVLRSDGISQFGWIRDSVVYYESDGERDSGDPIDLIVDHGARSTSRYERISPRPGALQAGLVTVPAGVYWWTSADGNMPTAEFWRWDPETDAVAPFPLVAASVVRHDDDSFFYVDPEKRLVVRPQLPGPPDLVVDMPAELPPANPLGIDGDEIFYVKYASDALDGDLVARGADGIERTLVTGYNVVGGSIDATHVYFTVDCGVQDGGPLDQRCKDVYRVPRAGGPIETVFSGEPNTAVFDVVTDRCNVYWQQYRMDGSLLYGRGTTP